MSMCFYILNNFLNLKVNLKVKNKIVNTIWGAGLVIHVLKNVLPPTTSYTHLTLWEGN